MLVRAKLSVRHTRMLLDRLSYLDVSATLELRMDARGGMSVCDPTLCCDGSTVLDLEHHTHKSSHGVLR